MLPIWLGSKFLLFGKELTLVAPFTTSFRFECGLDQDQTAQKGANIVGQEKKR